MQPYDGRLFLWKCNRHREADSGGKSDDLWSHCPLSRNPEIIADGGLGVEQHQIQTLEEVPAHRVVNRSGLLTGKIHFGDNQTMQHLLEAEGILVKDNQIVKMENYFWDPFTELIK